MVTSATYSFGDKKATYMNSWVISDVRGREQDRIYPVNPDSIKVELYEAMQLVPVKGDKSQKLDYQLAKAKLLQ